MVVAAETRAVAAARAGERPRGAREKQSRSYPPTKWAVRSRGARQPWPRARAQAGGRGGLSLRPPRTNVWSWSSLRSRLKRCSTRTSSRTANLKTRSCPAEALVHTGAHRRPYAWERCSYRVMPRRATPHRTTRRARDGVARVESTDSLLPSLRFSF